MYSLTINGLKDADDKITIIVAMLSLATRYEMHAEEIENLKSERVEVQKLVESYRSDAAKVRRILEHLYNARTELQSA